MEVDNDDAKNDVVWEYEISKGKWVRYDDEMCGKLKLVFFFQFVSIAANV